MLTIIVFNSGFSERSVPPLDSSNQSRRLVIRSPEPFELLYATIYYLYTDKVLFGADDTGTPGMPSCEAEKLFAIAHRLDMSKLMEKALNFLIETCTIENVMARVFGEFALTHDELVGPSYTIMFHRYWPRVKASKEFEEYFLAIEEEDQDRGVAVNRRFRELMRSYRYVEACTCPEAGVEYF